MVLTEISYAVMLGNRLENLYGSNVIKGSRTVIDVADTHLGSASRRAFEIVHFLISQ